VQDEDVGMLLAVIMACGRRLKEKARSFSGGEI
jgi:hypothetical protein